MINKYIGIGHLTKNPELKNLGDYQKCAFSIAINSSKDEVIFMDIECWGKVAQNCDKFLSKGSCVYVEGKIKVNKWKDKNDNPKQKWFIAADIVRFLPNGKKVEEDKNIENPKPSDSIKEIINEEEMPF
jgi:single-strand DNA-binding protein